MFTAAKPIWPKGRETEINLFLEFSFTLPHCDALLRMTASTAYHVYVNGRFVDYGPARAGDGHFRVSEYALAPHLSQEANTVRVLVAGYCISCFEYVRHPSFLTLEALCEGRVLLATGRDPIPCREYTPRLRYTEKYARQRAFTEIFDLSRLPGATLDTEIQPEPVYLARRTPYCRNLVIRPESAYEEGEVRRGETELPDDYRLFHAALTPETLRFDTLECHLFREMDMLSYGTGGPVRDAAAPLRAGRYRAWKLPRNSTGLISLRFRADSRCEMYFLFDELLVDGKILNKRANCINCVKIAAPEGAHHVLTFEPYTFQYGKLCVTEGSLSEIELSLVEIAYPTLGAEPLGDAELDLILESAIETFRQNATDIFMDCPSRERAGWLCDSFFTGRSEWTLTGSNCVEHSFLENFVRTAGYCVHPSMPEGMFPMCYPSSHDFIGGPVLQMKNYIPNWAMWLVIELEEFVRARKGDPALAALFREPIGKLLAHLEAYKNADGLLEDLPGWIFLEWSRANDPDVVCGVNYPTNMLYSTTLDAASALYGNAGLAQKAETIRAAVRGQAFDGHFFVDNATRTAGELRLTGNRTEVCQYYAFFTGTATKASHPGLFETLMSDFGPQRKQTNLHPNIAFANAFIGNYLRMEVLRKEKRYAQMIREIRGYFLGMARRTGTLWEYDQEKASCNHGFASYITCLLLEAKQAGALGQDESNSGR